MKENERNYMDDLFRKKLYGFEADVEADDWASVARRLPAAKRVPLIRAWRYRAVAAAVLLALVAGGLYVFDLKRGGQPESGSPRPLETVALPADIPSAGQPESSVSVPEAAPLMAEARVPVLPSVAVHAEAAVTETPSAAEETGDTAGSPSDANAEETDSSVSAIHTYTAVPRTRVEATSGQQDRKAGETPRRNSRWGFGIGAGSVGTGTSNSLNFFATESASSIDAELARLNSPYFISQAPKTDIHHKTPVSVGLSAGYRLTGRLMLQAGITYTFLSSEWETNAVYYGLTKQKLHFIGMPLSLSYTFAEWRNLRFYVAGGVTPEVNVAGKQQSRIMVDDDEFRHETERVRMHEWLWSVNARAGVSYPVWRFVSVYAEAGADYYFDNGSDIETIRSEKPFNVGLQAGFRLGF